MKDFYKELDKLKKIHGVEITATIENEYIKGNYPYEWVLEKPTARIVFIKNEERV